MTTTSARGHDAPTDDERVNGDENDAPVEQIDGEQLAAILQQEQGRQDFEEEEMIDYGLNYKKVRSARREATDEELEEHTPFQEENDTVQSPTPSGSIIDHDDPDETPSIHSTPSNSLPPSRMSINRAASGTSSPRPFDRRFHARMSSSASSIPRIGTPGGPSFLNNDSRRISMLSQFTIETQTGSENADEEEQAPWEVVKWTKLKKISTQAFSEAGKRAFGRPSFLAVGAFIAIGTSKGLVLLFDYHQTLKSIIGQGTAGKSATKMDQDRRSTWSPACVCIEQKL